MLGDFKLRRLTDQVIEDWRVDFIKQKGADRLRTKAPRVSANSFIRGARALFAPEVVERVKGFVEVPEPVPFWRVKSRKCGSRYRSAFDMVRLLVNARTELAPNEPEQYKIFLLAAMAGLRRNEIDKLPWTAFRWDESVIRIETTRFFRPKSDESEGDVLVDPELLEIAAKVRYLSSCSE